ncbi:Surfactin synthase thioesterase subunit [Micromonospora sediminicola]|uniref:Surfactin synthase thioesterase subunit n=1 Tax=Micromonospora sediminicola TaxID=946078 RepID=A0A1A9B851_9ACTN|nr:thioesterase domain-containing protein [Micromonospora sediminicola]SBT65710.1 Surfactin synthase thioesterase subunit [Micromonospora sediminicola]
MPHVDKAQLTPQSQDGDRRWFKRFGRHTRPSGTRLFCFHHAGGSAAMYRHWPRLLPDTVEPIAVQLPGRADRFCEPAYDRMGPLVDGLVAAMEPMLDRPFACYGASMGSRVAWALTHSLRARGLPMPRLLYVANDPGPSLDGGTWPWEGREDGLEGYLNEMGGTPAEVLADPSLLEILLPTLRADLAVLSTHQLQPAAPLDIRIRAFAGAEDTSAPPERMAAWRKETSRRFDLDVLPGGHFFDAQAERRVLETIGRDLG